MGWGHWCGAAVPTMMEMVVAAQVQRFFHYTDSNYLQLLECEGGGICNVMVKGRCIKIFSTAVYVRPYFLIGWLGWR